MVPFKTCVIVAPLVYELRLGVWGRWCKLKEVCDIVPGVAEIAGIEFAPTPEELVSRFAALIRPSRLLEYARRQDPKQPQKKFFRHSIDGTRFWHTEVPTTDPAPPYVPFQLSIPVPYPEGLFVPEQWTLDTLRAIRLGAVAAADFGDRKIGFPPPREGRQLICLEGKREGMLVRAPDCVR